LELIAADRGPGIGLGVGLAAMVELADELDVDVRIGEGSCIWARKLREPRSLGESNSASAVGPRRDRTRSGDDGCFVRTKG